MNNDRVIKIWGQSIPVSLLKDRDREYLIQFDLDEPPPIEQLWREMDKAWDSLGLSETAKPSDQQMAAFYCHPVWVLNGFFSASDPQSSAHRDAIANAVLELPVRNIADYGGGMGELAIRMSRINPNTRISIIEPYPSDIGRHRVAQYANILYMPTISGSYDLVIAQDVLEHVEQPLKLAAQMVEATKMGGHLIFANCFYPVIKCHLPSTFYLRHTFTWVVKGMGLKLEGYVEGANHALVFRRTGNIQKYRLMLLDLMAKLVGPLLNKIFPIWGAILFKLRKKWL
jgi:hypothetical protein